MVGVEKKKKVTSADGNEYDTGQIDVPKNKLRGGSKGTFKATFMLKESVEESTMDFNEPFITHLFTDELMGIRKHRGKMYIPTNLLSTHPEFESRIQPNLKPFPKGKEAKEGKEEKAEVEETTTEKTSEELYYTDEPTVLIKLLEERPGFEEECLLEHDIPLSV